MLKRIFSIVILICLMIVPANTEPWGGVHLTLTPGTAQHFVKTPTRALSLYIQMDAGGSGIGYVLFAPPNVTCTYNGAGTTLITKLSAATSTSLGGNVMISGVNSPDGRVSVEQYCVDGAQADPVIVSFNVSN